MNGESGCHPLLGPTQNGVHADNQALSIYQPQHWDRRTRNCFVSSLALLCMDSFFIFTLVHSIDVDEFNKIGIMPPDTLKGLMVTSVLLNNAPQTFKFVYQFLLERWRYLYLLPSRQSPISSAFWDVLFYLLPKAFLAFATAYSFCVRAEVYDNDDIRLPFFIWGGCISYFALELVGTMLWKKLLAEGYFVNTESDAPHRMYSQQSAHLNVVVRNLQKWREAPGGAVQWICQNCPAAKCEQSTHVAWEIIVEELSQSDELSEAALTQDGEPTAECCTVEKVVRYVLLTIFLILCFINTYIRRIFSVGLFHHACEIVDLFKNEAVRESIFVLGCFVHSVIVSFFSVETLVKLYGLRPTRDDFKAIQAMCPAYEQSNRLAFCVGLSKCMGMMLLSILKFIFAIFVALGAPLMHIAILGGAPEIKKFIGKQYSKRALDALKMCDDCLKAFYWILFCSSGLMGIYFVIAVYKSTENFFENANLKGLVWINNQPMREANKVDSNSCIAALCDSVEDLVSLGLPADVTDVKDHFIRRENLPDSIHHKIQSVLYTLSQKKPTMGIENIGEAADEGTPLITESST